MASGSETIHEGQNIYSDSSTTVRENQPDGNATIIENQNDGNATIREGQTVVTSERSGVVSSFRDYNIIKQLPSTSTEADIFIVEKDNQEYILKYYRYGIDPKADILRSIKELSEKYPHNFIRVFEVDYDAESKRWFEIQEYAKFGTLQAVIDDRSKLTEAQQKSLFNDVASQIGEALNLLHQNNMLHLDTKPSNILLRSFNPLNMVLIDFGIATSLASDMSKKFTQTRGTPMYQSPESWSGGVGRPSDWWGLGMILLEIAAGSHPFKGVQSNVIERALATRPAPIPENLDSDKKELLYGLLTRDPDKRWNWAQVSRWLNGERSIPEFFEKTSEETDQNISTLTFMGEKYRSLRQLAQAFIVDEDAWVRGREFLMRGYVRQWLESNQKFEECVELDRLLDASKDDDQKTFSFIQKFGKNLPFVFGGKAITIKNLFLFAGKSLRREHLSEEEVKIVKMLPNGRLLSCLNIYEKQQGTEDTKAVRIVLENLRSKSLQDIVSILDFYVNPENYYCPFITNTSTPEDVVKHAVALNGEMPVTMDVWEDWNKKYIIPESIIERTRSASSYNDAFKYLDSERRLNNLVQRQGYTDSEIQAIKSILSALSELEPKYSSKEFLDFYLHPEKYYCPFIKDAPSPEKCLDAVKRLNKLPMPIENWAKLEKEYILPKSLVEQTNDIYTYQSAVDQVLSMQQNQQLISSDNQKAKEDLADASMHDYMEGVYKWNFGYDEAAVLNIKKAHSKLEEYKNLKSDFEKAQFDLCRSYLDYLDQRKVALTQEDKTILQNFSLASANKIEELLKSGWGYYYESIAEKYAQEKEKHHKEKTELFVIPIVSPLAIFLALFGYSIVRGIFNIIIAPFISAFISGFISVLFFDVEFDVVNDMIRSVTPIIMIIIL